VNLLEGMIGMNLSRIYKEKGGEDVVKKIFLWALCVVAVHSFGLG